LMSIGIDIGKDTFHIVTFNLDGQLVMRRQIKRLALVAVFEKLSFPLRTVPLHWPRKGDWVCHGSDIQTKTY
jgi:hypothetical protein